MTRGQSQALDTLWPRYGIDLPDGLLVPRAIFGRDAPLAVEIGFGDGHNLAAAAADHPQFDFLGIEVYRPGVGHLLQRLDAAGINNVRVIMDDAVRVLAEHLKDGALTQVSLLFPDPWPKKRHQKRRIVQPEFIALIARKLVPDGRFLVATDWSDYAEHIDRVLGGSQDFVQRSSQEASPGRIRTRFEARGLRLGHDIHDRLYVRRGASAGPNPGDPTPGQATPVAPRGGE